MHMTTRSQAAADVGADQVMAMTRVQTRNKLVGDLANNDIFDSDDDAGPQDGNSIQFTDKLWHNSQYEYNWNSNDALEADNQVLDHGLKKDTNAPKKQFNLFDKTNKAR